MKSTYFTGKLEITGGFEDPVALWAFDPDSVSFERVSESRIDSRSFGYIGEDLYFIRTYFLSDDLRDNGSTLTRLDAETGTETDLFPATISGQLLYTPLYLQDRVILYRFQPDEGTTADPIQETGTWVSDGTIDGTYQLPLYQYKDRPLSFAGDRAMPFLDGAIFDGTSGYIFGTRAVWYTDGTLEGSTPLTGDITIESTGQIYRNWQSQPFVQLNTASGPLALFQAETEEYGKEPWVTDGSPEGTRVIDIAPGSDSGLAYGPFAPFGGQAVFIGGTRDTGYELYITDGTPEGTRLLYEDIPGPAARTGNDTNFSDSRVFGDTLVFSWGGELWQTDGTTDGTRKFYSDSDLDALGASFREIGISKGLSDLEVGKGLTPGGFSTALEVGDLVFFTDRIGFPFDNSVHVFVTDGTVDGTLRLTPGSYSDGSDAQTTILSAYGDHVLFMLSNGDDDRFYATNGTVEGTFELDMDLPEGVTFSATDRIAGNLLFWETDSFLVFDDAPVSPGNDGIRMTSGGTLEAGAGDDRIEGSAQDDTIIGGSGSDSISGGPGDDLLIGTDVRQATTASGSQVFRVFQATLDRIPDSTGYNNWSDRLDSGERTLLEVIEGFVNSAEFQSTYGALDNSAFVSLLYQNVLGRAPDAAGLGNWVDRLEDGTSRAEVVRGFSESAEFKANTNDAASAYVAAEAAPFADDVYRLFQATLDRAPDLTGLENWSGRLGEGMDYTDVAAGFVNSAEFQNVYGALNNAAFVTLLYNNVLGRDPDAGGLANWNTQLAEGMSREEVVRGFAQSGEFTANTAQPFHDFMVAQEGDTIRGGAGNDLIHGGLLADTFQFDAADKGSDRVLQLDAWDSLEFTGFGYGSAAAVASHLTETANDVIFADQGVRVIFMNTDLATMEDVSIMV